MISKSLSQMFIVVVFLAVTEILSASTYSRNRYTSLLRNRYSNICPKPELPNGMIRMRLRGKFLRLDCAMNFTLVGAKYLLCKNGRWNSPAPICVQPGCSDLPLVDNGFIFYENEKAAATVYCDSSFKLAGPMYSYCNGTHWDRTLGNCRSSRLVVEQSCDFEVDDLCGWENEATHSVDWERSSGVVSRQQLKTGPKHDHTTGQPLKGYFMMVDSSQQYTNATAHLISPLYSSNYSTKACFRFFYHMFGDVGTLAVYVKPLSLELSDMLKQAAHFIINGNQGNAWNEGCFDLQKQTEIFQIVIQASLGMRYKSDIAIDDVDLIHGSYCHSNGTVIVPLTESSEEIFKIDSCVDRCEANVSASIDEDSQNVIHCGCTSDCVDNNLCCPDYAELCFFDEPYATEEDMVTQRMGQPIVWFSDMNYRNNERLALGNQPNLIDHDSGTVVTLGVLGTFAIITSFILAILYFHRDSEINFISWLKNRGTGNSDDCVNVSDEVQYLAVNDEISSISEECQSVDGLQLA